jgi:DNA-binding transcriptional regulator of glucitol operon
MAASGMLSWRLSNRAAGFCWSWRLSARLWVNTVVLEFIDHEVTLLMSIMPPTER